MSAAQGGREGLYIDNCIHWLTGTKKGTELYKIWEKVGMLGNGVEVIEPDKFFVCELGNDKITLWRDIERTREEMLKLSPIDEKEINHLIDSVKASESMEMPVEKPMYMMTPLDYIKLGKSMSGAGAVTKAFGKISLKEYAEKFSNPLLKKIMTDYMPSDYQAISFVFSYGTFTSGSGDIPAGGSVAAAKRMQDQFEGLGGKLFLNSAVKKIEYTGKKAVDIILSNGKKISADYVIAACDTDFTFGNLLDKSFMSKKMRLAYQKKSISSVFSGFHAAFSVDNDFSEVEGTLLFNCDRFNVGETMIDRMGIRSYTYDKSLVKPGMAIIQCQIMQFERDFDYWKGLYADKEKYNAQKLKTANELLTRIEKRFPSQKGHIKVIDTWTPATYNRYCNSYNGAYMSFMITKESGSVKFKASIKGLDNVFIASQWLSGPGGLPTAVATGKFAIQHILKKEKRSISI